MSNNKIRTSNPAFIIFIIFFMVGVLLFIPGVKGICRHYIFQYEHRNDIQVTANIEVRDLENGEGYNEHLYLIYNVNGQEHEKVVDGEKSLYGKTSQIIYCDPEDNDVIWYNEGAEDVSMGYIVFSVIGFIFILVSVGLGILPALRESMKVRLKKNGICKRLPIVEIVEDRKNRVNNCYAQYVVLEDRREEEDTVYVYQSQPVFTDLHTRFSEGVKLSVYIDPTDADNYYVDLNS